MVANDRGQSYINCGIVLTVLATCFVISRFIARWKSGVSLGMDDAMIVVATLIAYSMLGEGVIWARDGGLGKPFLSLSPKEQEIFWKCFLANQFSYTFLIPSIKTSVLLFYRRLFGTSRNFHIATIVAGVIVIMWCLAVFFTAIFQCNPIPFFWDRTIQGGTCIDPQTFFWGNSISNLLTDVIILALPLPMIWNLNMAMWKKVAVIGIFLLGGFVCIASIMRIVTLGIIENSDISYSLLEPAMWTEVEPCVGIICACLPTLRPLFKECISGLSSRYSPYATPFSSRKNQSGRTKSIRVTRSYGVVTDDEDDRRYGHYMDQGGRAPAGQAMPPSSGPNRANSTEEYPLTDISSVDRSDYQETHSKV